MGAITAIVTLTKEKPELQARWVLEVTKTDMKMHFYFEGEIRAITCFRQGGKLEELYAIERTFGQKTVEAACNVSYAIERIQRATEKLG